MSDNKSLLSSGWAMVGRNKRYIFWFWLLNLILAQFGTAAFTASAHVVLDHSLFADRLVHGFYLPVMAELFLRPEFGQMAAMGAAGVCFAIVFFLATALLLPGVFQGYASTYRLPREDFFRACGRNLWRYIRLLLLAGLVMISITVVLFIILGELEKKIAESTNELLLPGVRFAGLAVIFLVMTCFRICFDLAEADVVLSDQRAVRKSFMAGLRHTFEGLVRLLPSYLVATITAGILLVGGLWVWMRFVAPESVGRAFLVGQLTLLLLLVPRFWQRGAAVSYWQQKMMAPVVPMHTTTPLPVMSQRVEPPPIPTAQVPEAAPVIPNIPPEPQAS